QTPNHKVLGFWKLQLATYNLSGNDSTKWYNRWVRRMGQPPVIYDEQLTEASVSQLKQAMVNRGYLESEIEVERSLNPSTKKASVVYRVKPGTPHLLRKINYEVPDTTIASIIFSDTTSLELKKGGKFDRDNLDAVRAILTRRLRDNGYYSFNKEYITFYADTAEGSKEVDLTLVVRPPRQGLGMRTDTAATHPRHTIYYIRNVIFITDGDDLEGGRRPDKLATETDTVDYKNIIVIYGKDHYIRPSILEEKNFIRPGELYNVGDIDRTYEALSRLSILRSVDIDLRPAGSVAGLNMLDAVIILRRQKKQAISLDVEGTNSEGDLGFGVGVTYQHRNLNHGSQMLTSRMRVNYESLSGNLNGLINDRYTEYAGEVAITFPRFEFPFSSRAMQRRLNVSTEFALSFNYQERPEYTRIIAGGAWKYKWVNRSNTRRHNFDLLDFNYVYLPKRTLGFLDQIAPDNPLLRYSYEDHFIMSMRYSYIYNNKRPPVSVETDGRRYIQKKNVYTIRTAFETAGNLLYLGSKIFRAKRHDGAYELFGIRYSQYVKGEIDYALTHNYSPRQSLAFHVGAGVGVPYGNSEVLPFEKRFYGGGANGVRGWSVRTLGPGRYDSRNSVSDFINQCGDIRLDMSVEFRSKLFWVLEGAAFIDAGNI
ncbi:MAG: BamA/TamA family outer membrane protein, partial [Duncaniella sp.]|nr:BamA/TamA family outer membrane protein [Duncaniella sp.]